MLNKEAKNLNLEAYSTNKLDGWSIYYSAFADIVLWLNSDAGKVNYNTMFFSFRDSGLFKYIFINKIDF